MKFIFLIFAFYSTISCSFGPFMGKKNRAIESTYPINGQNFIDQSKAYPNCEQIVVSAIYNNKIYEQDLFAKVFLVNSACEFLDNIFNSSPEKLDKICNTTNDESPSLVNLEKIIDVVSIGETDEYKRGDPKKYCNNETTRLSYIKVWKDNMCKNFTHNSSLPSLTNYIIHRLNSSSIGEWKQCLLRSHAGLICHAQKIGEKNEFKIESYNHQSDNKQLEVDFKFSGISVLNELPKLVKNDSAIFDFAFDNGHLRSYIEVTSKKSEKAGVDSCFVELPSQEVRICEEGNLIGSLSKNVDQANASICKKNDKCEVNRLRAVFEGKIDWNVYNALIKENATVYFSEENNSLAIAECNEKFF